MSRRFISVGLSGLRAGMGTHKGRPYDMMYEPEIHQRRSIRLKSRGRAPTRGAPTV